MSALVGLEHDGERAVLFFVILRKVQVQRGLSSSSLGSRRERGLCWPLKPGGSNYQSEERGVLSITGMCTGGFQWLHGEEIRQAHSLSQQPERYFVLRRWFLVQERGLGPWRGYKSQLQTLLRLVHFSHGRNTEIKILEWADICLGNDLGSKEEKGHHRNSFKYNSHGQS